MLAGGTKASTVELFILFIINILYEWKKLKNPLFQEYLGVTLKGGKIKETRIRCL